MKQEIVILDFEGFRYKKTGLIIKELLLCSNNYSDTILFLLPVSYHSLSASDMRYHKWVTRFLHDLSCNSGTYPYWFLSRILVAIKLRFPLGKFYAKGKEKTESLQTLLQKEVIDLKTLLCPKFEDIKSPIGNITCALHSFYLPEKQKRKHCAKGKHSWISIGSLCHPMSRRVENATPFVLQVNLPPSLMVCSYITNDNQLTLTLLKEEKIESRGQNILQIQQILCNTKEIETLKKYFSLLEYFEMYHVVTTENEKT